MNGEIIYQQADEEIKLLEEQMLNGYGLTRRYDDGIICLQMFISILAQLLNRGYTKILSLSNSGIFFGHDVYYLPRKLVNEDTLFGEDRLS